MLSWLAAFLEKGETVLVVAVAPSVDQVFGGLGPVGNSNWKPALSRRVGMTRRLLRTSSVSVRKKEGAEFQDWRGDGEAVGDIPGIAQRWP